nr:hypothetical protein [Tanacetum cinerariifolium]
MTESPLVESGFTVPIFSLGNDPIACLNKEMAFLTAVVSLRFPSTNNQHRTSSNPRNQATIQDACSKEKAMLVEADEAGQILDEEQLSFLADLKNAKVVLMANISNYGSDVILKVPHSETYLNDVLAIQDFEQPPAVDFTDNEIHSDSNIISYS